MRTRTGHQTLAVTVLAFLGGAADVSAALYGEWAYHARITFSGYGRPEILTNFPVLVELGTNRIAGFDFAQFKSATNADLRFADATRTNELNYEVERWDTNGLSHVWVQVPALASNTQIWALWGRTGETAPACTTNGATWDSSFRGVWHLSETNGTTLYDATSNKTAGTCSGGVTVNAAGKIAGGDRYDGVNDLATMANENLFDFGTNAFTASFWARNAKFSPFRKEWTILSKGTPYQPWGWEIEASSWATPPSIGTYVLKTAVPGYGVNLGVGSLVPSNDWHHIVLVRDGSNAWMYADGVRQSTTNHADFAQDFQNTYALRIANPIFDSVGFGGDLDEVRMESAARSSNRVWACWLNQASNAVFATYGRAEVQARATIVTVK